MSDTHSGDAAVIDRMISAMTQAGDGAHLELLLAVKRREIAFAMLLRGEVPPMGALKRSGKPTIVLIGDDDYRTSGPTGWAGLRPLMRWARFGLVHAAGADVATYRHALRLVRRERRLVMVETAASAHTAWRVLFNAFRVPADLIYPEHGIHPTMAPHDEG
ncbi:MAG: hypothetical protein NT133_01130 [Alphaproteobacteria bacterium]|nr:hypothetical protein [Alphaproteobacteria bacterium]